MRLPSLQLVATEAFAVGRRFPIVLLSSVVAASAAIGMAHNFEAQERLQRILMCAGLGLAGFTALDLWRERAVSARWAWPLRIAGIGLLVILYFSLASWSDPILERRYIQLSLATHLAVAFLPYLGRSELRGFWQFNRTLFLRFLVSGLFAAVLFVGLAIALLAIDKLFGADLPERVYVDTLFVIGFIFTTLYFLGGVPAQLAELEQSEDYPRGLKIFAQYILLPIVALYVLILTAYLGKVLILRAWPSGWIGYLVSSVSAAGVLSLLLLHPIEMKAENRWVSAYSRSFYFAILPAIVMLLLAIGKRIGQYGITENRYFMAVLALWMAAISLFFAVRRSRNILWIPATLFALAALTSFGPWGAYQVSRRSQLGRLQDLLERHQMLHEGAIRAPAQEVPREDRQQIAATFVYLLETHGPDPIQSWYGARFAEIDTLKHLDLPRRRGDAHTLAQNLMAEVGLEYVEPIQRDSEHFNHWSSPEQKLLAIEGYTQFCSVTAHSLSQQTPPPTHACSLSFDAATQLIAVRLAGELVASIDVAALPLPAGYQDAMEPLIHREESEAGRVMVVIYSVSGRIEDGQKRPDAMNAGIYFAPR